MEWLLLPLLAGLLLAFIGGPLGSFIIWQRMAYMGESIAHSALLGVGLSVLFDFSLTLTVIFVCCGVALLLNRVQKNPTLSINTLLAIIAHTSLASGLVIISLIQNFRLDINSFLFGDLLAVNTQHVIMMLAIGSAIALFLFLFWRPLISLAANEELAFVEGIKTKRLQLFLHLALALLIAVGIKSVGVLLIVSLLIIPAATSRKWSQSPEAMALLASILGSVYVGGGLFISYLSDTPAGPTIVALAGFGYFASQLLPKK